VAHAPRALQLHGDETPELWRRSSTKDSRCGKVISGADLRVRAREFTDAGAEMLVVDAREETESGIIYGGTGRRADWNAARTLVDEGFRVVLAGGLDAENLAPRH
jgi:phosphoribosylanthranilate isomerase